MTTPRPPTKAAFIFVFITVALDMLALGIIIPVLPQLIRRFEGGDLVKAAEITGVFGTVWALMQFVFSPVMGALSDRFGRRPVILLSNLGLGLDYLLMALAPTLAWLFVGRVISGITAASFSTASAYIADVTPPEKRAARFGMLGAAFGLGFIIGPALGGLLGGVSLRLPFWVAGALSILNAAYGLFVLPESLPAERRSPFRWSRANPVGALKLLRSHPEVSALALAAFASALAHEALPSVFVLYTNSRYGWTEAQVGLALAGIGVASTLVAAGGVGTAVRKLGERKALAVGLICGAIGFGLYGAAPVGGIFLLGIPFVALWGLAGPSLTALITRHMRPDEQGQLQGALSSLRGITGMIGPLIFTQIFARALRASSIQLPGAPYLLASALLLVALALAQVIAVRAAPAAVAPVDAPPA